jgi:hypothetical protein
MLTIQQLLCHDDGKTENNIICIGKQTQRRIIGRRCQRTNEVTNKSLSNRYRFMHDDDAPHWCVSGKPAAPSIGSPHLAAIDPGCAMHWHRSRNVNQYGYNLPMMLIDAGCKQSSKFTGPAPSQMNW